MILLDGKKLSQKLLEKLKIEIEAVSKKLRLAVVEVGADLVIKKFIEKKREAGFFVGIDVRVYSFGKEITTSELRRRMKEIVHEEKNTGVIVQLPLPPQINEQYILNSVLPEKDADLLSARSLGDFVTGRSHIFPPVAGAVKTFFEEYGIDYRNKRIVIFGAGKLVGKPTALWLLNEKATFSVVRSTTQGSEKFLREADIIISGIGKPKFITAEEVKKDVVIIDAGTSESAGKIVGDADLDSLRSRASYITPVPGGVGPLTVAILFKNLVMLAKSKKS